MKDRITRFFVSFLTVFTMVITAMAIVDFSVSIVGNEGLDKAYAMGRKHKHRYYVSPTGGGGEETPVHTVPEPSTLVLIGSALGAGGLYKMMKSRKRDREN